MATLSISTTLLYGVYVSEKSHLIGVRCLVKKEHSKMLAHRVAGHLPQELVDLIAGELYELEKSSVIARWERGLGKKNHQKFQYESMTTEAETAVCRKLSTMGVTTTLIHNTKPSGGPERSPRYIHLSTLRTQPSIALVVPPINNKKTTSFAAGLPYVGNQGAIRVTLEGSPLRKSDKATYTPMVRESIPTIRLKPSVGRILSVGGLETAIKDWDPVALKAYVAILNLSVVPEDGDEDAESALRPKVHIWQQIDDVQADVSGV